MDKEKTERLLQAILELLRPESLTAIEFCHIIGKLMIITGEGLYQKMFPENDPRDLRQVEEDYVNMPNYGSALLLEGHMFALTGTEEFPIHDPDTTTNTNRPSYLRPVP